MPFLFLEPLSYMHDADATWAFAQSDDGKAITHAGQGQAALLPKPAKGWQVVLVLPVQDVSWHRVHLPQVSLKDRARLRAVIQGLLEDCVLDDAAALHYSLAPDAQPGQPCWVAACHAARLRGYLSSLELHGIAVQRIVPAFPPGADAQEAELYAVGTEDAPWLVLTPDAEGGVLALPLTAEATTLEAVAHSSAPVWAEPAVYQLAQQRLGRTVELMVPGQRLARAAASAWSLSQFQFANSGRDRLTQRLHAGVHAVLRAPQWRWLRWGAVTLVLVQVIGLQAWAWQARQDLTQQRAQVQQLFTSTFPHVPVVVDAPLQMQQELARLQQRSGALTRSAFEVLAGDAGAHMPDDVMPQEIRYDNGRLTLAGLSQGDARLQPWLARWAELGLQAQWREGLLHIEPVQGASR